jgi:phospholipid/cholesterol/gamma-HCH transport system substrate-binding protein
MNKEIKIGIIISLAIALFFWGFNYLKGNDLFKITDSYYITYTDVRGLQESNAVYLNGYKVGRVSSISLNEELPQQLIVSITVKSRLKIPVNSIGRIYSVDVMGSKAIELVLSDNKKYYHNKDTLKGEVELSISKQIEPVKNEMINIMNKMETLVNTLNAAFDIKMINDLRRTTEALKKTTEALSSSSENITSIIQNIESVTQNLKKNNQQMTIILSDIASLSDSLSHTEIKTTIANLNASIIHSNEILEKIDSGKGSLGMLVNNDSLYINLNNAAFSLDKLTRDLQENPKKYVHFSIFGSKNQNKK